LHLACKLRNAGAELSSAGAVSDLQGAASRDLLSYLVLPYLFEWRAQ
jgi:hypothetical protein